MKDPIADAAREAFGDVGEQCIDAFKEALTRRGYTLASTAHTNVPPLRPSGKEVA